MDDQLEYVNCIICGKDDTEVFIRGMGRLILSGVGMTNCCILTLVPNPAVCASFTPSTCGMII